MSRAGLLIGVVALLSACTTLAPPIDTPAPVASDTPEPTTASPVTPPPTHDETISPTPTDTPAPSPTATPAPSPTATPAPSPTATITLEPTATPSPTVPPTMPPAADIAAELRTAGNLDVCLAIVGAPAAAIDTSGELVGYNVSFARELADRLGLAVEFQQPLFDELIEIVEGHECDIAVSSQNITTTRLERVDFVAYTESLQPVLVAIGNPAGIDTLDDLCGKAVSATAGTTHVDLIAGTGDYVGEGLDDACVAAGQPAIDLRTYDTEFEAVTALLDDQVVAYLGNPSFAFDYLNQIEYADATLPPARQGITVAKDRPLLLTAVHASLGQMFADGSYRSILAQHLPNDQSIAVVSILE